MEYSKEAKDIVEAVGGKENIAAVTHCVTRLRFALNDEGKVDTEALEDMKIVKGSIFCERSIPSRDWSRNS